MPSGNCVTSRSRWKRTWRWEWTLSHTPSLDPYKHYVYVEQVMTAAHTKLHNASLLPLTNQVTYLGELMSPLSDHWPKWDDPMIFWCLTSFITHGCWTRCFYWTLWTSFTVRVLTVHQSIACLCNRQVHADFQARISRFRRDWILSTRAGWQSATGSACRAISPCEQDQVQERQAIKSCTAVENVPT